MPDKVPVPLFLIFWLAAAGMGSAGAQQDFEQVCFDDKCFTVEIADTPEARSRGLMWRPELPEGQGMFFDFGVPGIYYFWMKNVSFPIDMVWLDDDRKVVYVEKGAPPCQQDPCPTYGPNVSARYVLEITGGAFDRYHLQVGDQAELK